MARISFIKKIRLFFSFRKTLKKISPDLENNFNTRVDGASRLYTVINVPPNIVEEPYNLRKEDIDNIARSFIQEYSKKLSTFLNSKGLMELYDFYEVKKIDKYSYLVIMGFSLFNSTKFLTRFYFSLYSLITLLFILLIVCVKTFL
jgi:hypothetical protein